MTEKPILPQWFLRAQAISKPLSIGFLTAIGFIMYFPGIKPSMSIKVAVGNGYINIYEIVLLVLIMLTLPCIILAGRTINLQDFIKKS